MKLILYLNVLNVSPWLTSAGLIVAIMIVLEFPPSESFRSHVRTESRYGIKGCNKKNKKISVKTPTISSHEYIMCSLRTPLHDIWFDSGVTSTTTTYE